MGTGPSMTVAAAVDDDGPVADCSTSCSRCELKEDGGAAGAQLADQLAHVFHALRIEAARGLVQDDDLGPGEQRVGYAQALLHAVRVAAHLAVAARQQADRVEHLADAFLGCAAAGRADQPQVATPRSCWGRRPHLDEAAQVRSAATRSPGTRWSSTSTWPLVGR